ncbi:MAG TPA: peptidoglycan-binding domain-containing protein [Candidatus Saccharimonadales bacterium]|nr:peptidoglycan-binding domain-containing protein [Candidatus Saccharimonadales bacterium]
MGKQHRILGQAGFSHLIAILGIAVVLVGIVGTYLLVRGNAESSCYYRQFQYGSIDRSGSTCVHDIQKLANYQLTQYVQLSVDGDFGSHTRAGVITVQRLNGIGQDGIVGPHTWYALCRPKGHARAESFSVYLAAARDAGCPIPYTAAPPLIYVE